MPLLQKLRTKFSKKKYTGPVIRLPLVSRYKSLFFVSYIQSKQRLGIFKIVIVGLIFSTTLFGSLLTLVSSDTFKKYTGNAEARGSNLFAGAKYYINPNSKAYKEYYNLLQTNKEDASQIYKIASSPQAIWFGGWNKNIESDVDARTTEIISKGALPVYVLYNIPNRDCGNHSAGGAESAQAYRDWVNKFANGLRNRKAVLIVEPDALGLFGCLSSEQQQTRTDLLKHAVDTFGANPNTSVYLEASTWVNPQEMASRLTKAGISNARGISLNTSGFSATSQNLDFLKSVNQHLEPDVFAVIDTSRNGLGSHPDKQWCNPDGRALGAPATTRTESSLIDAYYWVKAPGESDGSCNGGPGAGQWWTEYALGLAKRSPFFTANPIEDKIPVTPDPSSTPTPIKKVTPTAIPKITITPAPTNSPKEANSTIKIYAAGTAADNEYPNLELLIGSETVFTAKNVQGNPYNREFVEYSYTFNKKISAQDIRLKYSNDASGVRGDDRNIRIDKIVLDGATYEVEATSTLYESQWNGATGVCSTGLKATEWLYCNGALKFDNAATIIGIYAAGTVANNVYPTMEVWIKGEKVKTFENVNSNPYKRPYTLYTFVYSTVVNISDIVIKFVNDISNRSGEDRNLIVDKVELNGVPYEIEAEEVESKGSWSSDSGCGEGTKESEWLHCNGYFDFN